MDKKVIFFEVEGGTDKGPDGYRQIQCQWWKR